MGPIAHNLRAHFSRYQASNKERVDAQEAIALITDNNLWLDVIYIIPYFTSYSYRDALIVQ
jgi:hypothetical protein